MSIGIAAPLPAYTIDPAFMGRKAEALGFESLWYAEHPAVPVESSSPFPATGGEVPWQYSHFDEPYIALARASAVTTKILLATGITLVPQRHPLVLAKVISSLDYHSNGRFLFGVGTGWLKEEVELMGGNFRMRWTQTREYIEAMKAVWADDAGEYHGRFIDFPPVRVYPKPVSKPHPPVIIGGMAPKVLERIVESGDGWLPNRVTPSEVEAARRELDSRAKDAGRDPSSISISIFGQPADPAAAHSYLDAGADRVVIRPEHVKTEDEMGAQMEEIAAKML